MPNRAELEIGRLLAQIDRRLRSVEAAQRSFKYVALDGGSLPVYDEAGTLRQVVGQQEDGTYTQVDYNGPALVAPSLPIVLPTPGSLVIRWDGQTNDGSPWPLDFSHVEVHLSSTAGYIKDDTTQIAAFTSLKGGEYTVASVDEGTTYYAALVAVNTSKVESAPTLEVPATPLPSVDPFRQDLILSKRIQTGQMDDAGQLTGQHTDLSPAGLESVRADGSLNAFIPNDPEAAAFLRAALETDQLRVLGGLAIESDRNEFSRDSTTMLSAGVSDPTEAPRLELVYDSVNLDTTTAVTGVVGAASNAKSGLGTFKFDPSQVSGFSWHFGVSKWIVAQSRVGGTRVWYFNPDGSIATNPATGALWVADYPDWYDMTIAGESGVSGDGGDVMMLFRQGTDWLTYGGPTSGGRYYVNWMPSTSWRVNNNQIPVLAWDKAVGRMLLLENRRAGASDNNIVIRRIDPVQNTTPRGSTTQIWGTASLASVLDGPLGTGRAKRVAGLVRSDEAGVGSRYVWATFTNNSTAVITTGGVSDDSGYSWDMGYSPVGFTHNGSQFASLSTAGQIRLFSNWTWTDAASTFYAANTWYDSGRGNGVIHETELGKVASITLAKRAKVRVTVGVVPDKFGVDDPDQFRLYAARSSAEPGRTGLPLVFTGGSASTPTVVDVPTDPTGTTYSPPSPNPYAFPGANPARLFAATLDAAGRPKFQADGAGGGRWPRLLPVGTVFEWSGTKSAAPEGWLFCDTAGTTVSRTKYPELAALYWNGTNYQYGNGDGSTTFTLPVYTPRIANGRVILYAGEGS